MAVIITDFGMPSCCENCEMCSNRRLDTFYCCITLKDVDIDSNKRDADCPLKEVPSGKWIDLGFTEYEAYHCSNCMTTHSIKTNYCPTCGCVMQMESEDKK